MDQEGDGERAEEEYRGVRWAVWGLSGKDWSPIYKASRRVTGLRIRTQKRSKMEGDGRKWGRAWRGDRDQGKTWSFQVGIHHTSETCHTIAIHSGWEFQTHSSYLRQVVGIWQFGCHIEPKVFVVVNIRVSKVNEQSSTTHEGLFQKNGFQSWIQDFFKLKD